MKIFDMKNLLFNDKRKLKEDYKTITVSATELQRFLFPPMYTIDDKEVMEEVFTYWDYVEQIWNATIRWRTEQEAREWWYAVADYVKSVILSWDRKRDEDKKKDFEWLALNCRNIVDLTIKNWLHEIDRLTYNFRQKIAIEAWWYKVILSWEYDAAQPGMFIADCKTAWTKWDDQKINNSRQKVYYPLMDMHYAWASDDDTIVFSYQIFTKHKKTQFQFEMSEITYWEAKKILEEDLFKYLKHLARKDKSWQTW